MKERERKQEEVMLSLPWWQKATIYQIYPKSFQASADQACGDLQGIISRLNYLTQLEVDAIWLTPVYCSPQVDNGYDIADYYAIDPAYGSMTDFEALVAAAHQRGIRIIIDIVVNHTSTQHPWFQSAYKSRQSPYRDYYIWRDPVAGGEPNNWQSKFGGSAWAWEPDSQQYYLHLFSTQQADLNWENPAVRMEVQKILRFWADKGVDGFRLDVINLISKDPAFTDDPNGDGRIGYTDGPHCHDYLAELNQAIFTPLQLMTVGEMSSTSLGHCQRYAALTGEELSMVFNFHHLKVDYRDGNKWTLMPFDFLGLKQIIAHWQTGMHQRAWSALFWCNHDQPRIVSRFGTEGALRVRAAKMLATTLYGWQGTPYIYQGEEIGMTNSGYQHIEQYQDVESHNLFATKTAQGVPEEEILAVLAAKSRDNARSPMQWNSGDQAGFTQGQPWLPVAENYRDINVESALTDPDSLFWHYRHLIRLRKRYPLFIFGEYRDILPEDGNIWVYTRQYQGQILLVVSNFYPTKADFILPLKMEQKNGKLLISNYTDSPDRPVSCVLRPYESLMWILA